MPEQSEHDLLQHLLDLVIRIRADSETRSIKLFEGVDRVREVPRIVLDAVRFEVRLWVIRDARGFGVRCSQHRDQSVLRRCSNVLAVVFRPSFHLRLRVAASHEDGKRSFLLSILPLQLPDVLELSGDRTTDVSFGLVEQISIRDGSFTHAQHSPDKVWTT